MKIRTRFPIRLKFLLTMLLVVTAVVSVITFTMATLFHDDKTTYINDLISLVGLSAAEECRSMLTGYGERLEVYSRIMRDTELPEKRKNELLQGLFDDFPELVAVELYEDGRPTLSAFDANTLEQASLSRDDIMADREQHPLPMERIEQGEWFVRNSTLSEALPLMTLALAPTTEPGERPAVIVAGVRLNKLMGLASRYTAFDVSLSDAEGTLLAHRDPDRVFRRGQSALQAESPLLEMSASMTREIVQDGTPMLAAFSGVNIGGVVATAQIPKSAAFLASRNLLKRLVVVALTLLALAALASLFWARRLTRNVELLSRATREIAKGRFDIQVMANTSDEIGALAGSFNQMASELKDRENELDGAQAQLVQSAKMAAFGQLGAGIAHEVKNPLAGIRGCAQLSLRKIDENSPLLKNLRLIERETKRCEAIIKNLLKFARQEKPVMEAVQLESVVEDAVSIVHHHLELSHVSLEHELSPDLPALQGNANQLQQVLVNLLMNAQQAMEGEPGTVRVSARAMDTEWVEVRISDTGPGIPQEVQDRIFDPFFTTKPSGKGTGLGLSVSFGIVEEHGGTIRVESEMSVGTTFVIKLPMSKDYPVQVAPETRENPVHA